MGFNSITNRIHFTHRFVLVDMEMDEGRGGEEKPSVRNARSRINELIVFDDDVE